MKQALAGTQAAQETPENPHASGHAGGADSHAGQQD
jgi:hypothetical protein